MYDNDETGAFSSPRAEDSAKLICGAGGELGNGRGDRKCRVEGGYIWRESASGSVASDGSMALGKSKSRNSEYERSRRSGRIDA